MTWSDDLTWWLVGASVATFVASLLAIPAIIIRLPVDYFCHSRRHRAKPQGFGLAIYYGWMIAKNIAGVVFGIMGIAMLVLPGQGILSILIGLSLMNFPGKYRLERFLISRKPVMRSVNWIRHKAGKPSLQLDEID